CFRIEVANAVVVRQAGLRAHAHARTNRHAAADSRDARTAAEVTGDHAERGFVHGSCAAVHVKFADAFGNVAATEQFRRAFGDEFVACAMKTPAADTNVAPRVRHGV